MKLIITVLLLLNISYAATEIVKIGVLAKRGSAITMRKWSPTADYLSMRIMEKKFQIVPIKFDEILSAVKNKEIDFILTNPGFYVTLEQVSGVERIATLVNKHIYGSPQTEFGGVIFTLDSKKDRFNTLKSLVDAKVSAVDEQSLGGWQVVWRELIDNGIDVKDLESLKFRGTHDKVVYAVLQENADVGVVRTDTLERMGMEGMIDLKRFHVINMQKHEGFPFLSSTRLYPEWPFAKLKHTDAILAKRVAIALLQISPSEKAARKANIHGWVTPLNYQSVHDCFKAIKVAPYDK